MLDCGAPVERARVRDAVRGYDGDVPVVGELDVTRLGQEGDRIRGDEALALADTDHERALPPRPDDQVGVVAVDDHEGEVAFELPVREPHGLGEIAVVVALDQVRNRLGVGLGREAVALLDQGRAQLAVVLDDAVENDGYLALVTTGERVCVLDHDLAVRGPARMP